jgi:hypothetical protein
MKNTHNYTIAGHSRSHTYMTSSRKKDHKPKQTPGSLKGRYPIVLNDGRTIIYISDPSKEQEVRDRYAS